MDLRNFATIQQGNRVKFRSPTGGWRACSWHDENPNQDESPSPHPRLRSASAFGFIAAIFFSRTMSQLCIAAMDGHVARVRDLLATADTLPHDRAAALVQAAARGHYSIVEALLAAQTDPNQISAQGGALHCAVLSNHLDVVRSLLQGNAMADLRDCCRSGRGWTPLMYAASLGHMAIAHLLLSYGADVNGGDRDGQTPLIIAANAGNTAMVLLLIQAGADSSGQDHYGNTALSYARNAKSAGDERVLDRLPQAR